MKRRRHTPEQIVRKLREADRLLGEGQTLPEVVKGVGGVRGHVSPLAGALRRHRSTQRHAWLVAGVAALGPLGAWATVTWSSPGFCGPRRSSSH